MNKKEALRLKRGDTVYRTHNNTPFKVLHDNGKPVSRSTETLKVTGIKPGSNTVHVYCENFKSGHYLHCGDIDYVPLTPSPNPILTIKGVIKNNEERICTLEEQNQFLKEQLDYLTVNKTSHLDMIDFTIWQLMKVHSYHGHDHNHFMCIATKLIKRNLKS